MSQRHASPVIQRGQWCVSVIKLDTDLSILSNRWKNLKCDLFLITCLLQYLFPPAPLPSAYKCAISWKKISPSLLFLDLCLFTRICLKPGWIAIQYLLIDFLALISLNTYSKQGVRSSLFILGAFSFKMAFCFMLYPNQFLKGPFIVSLMFTFWHECLVVSVL